MLRGELTNLRAIERADAGALFRWFNDPAVMYGWGLPDATVSLNETQRRIETWLDEESRRGRPVAFVIEDLTGEPVGLAIVSRIDETHRSCELSLLIGEQAAWGQGYGTDALTTIADACFEEWQVHRLQLRVEADNARAIRLYERCGFRREAALRDASYHSGRFHDLYVYGLLATDPRPELGSVARG